jgi:uncharacterized protein (DUF58 family)
LIPDRLRALITRRIRYRLTSGGAIFFVALALTGMIAFVSGNNLLFLIFAAMLALLLVSGFLSRLVLAGLEIELLLPAHVAARMPSAARIRIRNLKRFTPSFSIGVSGCVDSSGGEPIFTGSLYFPLIPGGAMREAETSVLFPRRGSHRENVFALSTAFPYAFLHKTVQVALRRETVVYPAMTAGPGIEELAASLKGDASSAVRGAGRDFYRIRPYEADDSARHVDWKSTAHTGSLQVREFLRDRDRAIEVVFDRAIPPGSEAAFESLIESCAFLLWHVANEDVECLFRSGDYYQALEDSLAVYDVLRFLALVEPLRDPTAPALENDDSGRQVLFSVRHTVSAL